MSGSPPSLLTPASWPLVGRSWMSSMSGQLEVASSNFWPRDMRRPSLRRSNYFLSMSPSPTSSLFPRQQTTLGPAAWLFSPSTRSRVFPWRGARQLTRPPAAPVWASGTLTAPGASPARPASPRGRARRTPASCCRTWARVATRDVPQHIQEVQVDQYLAGPTPRVNWPWLNCFILDGFYAVDAEFHNQKSLQLSIISGHEPYFQDVFPGRWAEGKAV